MLPTIEPRFEAYTCNSSRSAFRVTSTSSITGSHSDWSLNVSSRQPSIVCFNR